MLLCSTWFRCLAVGHWIYISKTVCNGCWNEKWGPLIGDMPQRDIFFGMALILDIDLMTLFRYEWHFHILSWVLVSTNSIFLIYTKLMCMMCVCISAQLKEVSPYLYQSRLIYVYYTVCCMIPVSSLIFPKKELIIFVSIVSC